MQTLKRSFQIGEWRIGKMGCENWLVVKRLYVELCCCVQDITDLPGATEVYAVVNPNISYSLRLILMSAYEIPA